MAILKGWDLWRKIQSARAQKNEQRASALERQYNPDRSPAYVPPLTYPTTNTRIDPKTDVLFKEPLSKSLNAVIDYDWIADHNKRIREAFPKNPLETSGHYHNRLVEELKKRKQNLDLLNQSITYNPDPTRGYFFQVKRDPKQRLYTTLDIETDDYGRPISISASRLQWNGRAKTFNAIDSYQRFYLAKNADLLSTFDVHGMTSAKLLSLRDQQKAHYSTKYNDKEQQLLKEYLGDSIIIGHNIVDFDLNRLFPKDPITNSTIDTLKAARSAWHGRENALHNVFYRLYGKTMEEMGLPHHDPNADTIASAMIAAKMISAKGVVPEAMRYVMQSTDPAHIAEWDDMLQSMITTGTYRDMYREGNLYEVFADMSKIYDSKGDPIGTSEELEKNAIQIKDYGELADMDTRAGLKAVQEQIDAIATRVNAGQGSGIVGHLSQELFEAVNTFNTYKHFDLVKRVKGAQSADEIDAIRRAYGQTEGQEWKSITEAAADWRSAEERRKREGYYKQIERYRRRGDLTKSQYEELHNIDHMRMSYDDLRDATEEMIDANQRLAQTYKTLISIKPYDPNQYLDSAKHQWSGITGAARGVIPSFIRNPISRLGDAAFNYMDRYMAPLNATTRTWNAVGTPLLSLAGTALGGPVGGLGGAALGAAIGGSTQIYGNYKQARMEMAGNLLQNNLNTLGAMISWITTPFQLLGKAIKLVTGAFGGLTFKLNNIMGSGLDMMNQMGQPLTELTGLSYVNYAGSKMLDRASLLPSGAMNSVYENFANQQQGLYMGQIDTNRMIAASMLGVYGDVYGSAGEKTDDVYNRMANKLLANMTVQSPEQKARTMYFASQIDKNLPSVLHTANLLGVTDISQLSNPGNRGMYWNPIGRRNPNEERDMRWAQYEYGAAREQFSVSKMRFANTLWSKMGGKQLYNAFNELVDTAATGNWEGALKRAGEMWDDFRTRFNGVWEAVKKTFSGEGGEGGEENGIAKTFKAVGLQLENAMISAGIKIVTVWDNIMAHIVDKLQGAVSYLSTIHLKPHWDWKNGLSFEMTSAADAMDKDAWRSNDKVFKPYYGVDENGNTVVNYVHAQKGMSGLAALADYLIPGDSQDALMRKAELTPNDLYYAAGQYLMAGNEIDLPERGIRHFKTRHSQPVKNLLTALAAGGKEGWAPTEGLMQTAANFLTDFEGAATKDYSIAGLGDVTRALTGAGEDVLTTVLSDKYNNNARAIAELRIVDEHGKKATMIADTEKGSTVSKDFVLLSQMLGQGLRLVVNEVK